MALYVRLIFAQLIWAIHEHIQEDFSIEHTQTLLALCLLACGLAGGRCRSTGMMGYSVVLRTVGATRNHRQTVQDILVQ